jgi:hypothetical protein
MAFFDDVLRFIGNVVDTVVYAAGTIVGIAAVKVVEFTEIARDKYHEYRARNKNVDLEKANTPFYQETHNLNDEIIELEAKQRRDRSLNQYDQQRLTSLYQKRELLKEHVRTNKELLIAERMDRGDGTYDSVLVQSFNSHIIQFHVGQTVFGKRCRQCGRPMTLQWKQGMQTVSMSDFFWGCIGFYEGLKHNEPFVQADMNLFTRVDRPEFEVSSQQLGSMLLLPGPKENVNKRMKEIKQQQTDVYLCPVHNEQMIVREKKDAEGLLDQYFFGCPRWKPDGNGCTQLVKLKSPAQLASALEAFYGRGVL